MYYNDNVLSFYEKATIPSHEYEGEACYDDSDVETRFQKMIVLRLYYYFSTSL